MDDFFLIRIDEHWLKHLLWGSFDVLAGLRISEHAKKLFKRYYV